MDDAADNLLDGRAAAIAPSGSTTGAAPFDEPPGHAIEHRQDDRVRADRWPRVRRSAEERGAFTAMISNSAAAVEPSKLP